MNPNLYGKPNESAQGGTPLPPNFPVFTSREEILAKAVSFSLDDPKFLAEYDFSGEQRVLLLKKHGVRIVYLKWPGPVYAFIPYPVGEPGPWESQVVHAYRLALMCGRAFEGGTMVWR